jgi:hypothetical protein
MKFNAMPSLEALHAIYLIDPESPSGLSRIVRQQGRYGGVGPVISNDTEGYFRMRFQGVAFRTHRIIYFMHTGHNPDGLVVDHIDGNKLNNSPENLRACTQQQNTWNTKRRSCDDHSLPKGVYEKDGMWCFKIRLDGEQIAQEFTNKKAALSYAEQIRKRYHGDFAKAF